MVACYSIVDDKLFPFNFYPSKNLTMTYECSQGLLNFILGDSTAVLRSLHILFHRSSNIRAAESAHQMHFLRFLRED